MKKSIASLAMLVSATSASALIGPRGHNEPKPVYKVLCLETYARNDGSLSLANCDAAANNKKLKAEILQNGCAEGQVALGTVNNDITIRACMPPGMAQL